MKHRKIFDPKEGHWSRCRRPVHGWCDYGWAWRWECERFKTYSAGTFLVKRDGPRPVDYPPPSLMKFNAQHGRLT